MKIRLGTFNLYQFVEPPYRWYTRKGKFNHRQWSEKTTWVKKQIVKMDCDIIGFQEVFSKDALKGLVEEIGFKYFKTVDIAKLSTNNPLKYITTTVAIASKHPITNIEEVKVHAPSVQKHNLEGDIKFSRVPIKATTKLPNGEELLVYVCHLKSNRRNEFEYVFDAQHGFEHKKDLVSKALEGKYAKALRQRLCEASSLFFDIKKSKDNPAVLLCDLNDKEFSITIDALSNNKYHDDTSKEHFLLHDPHPEQSTAKRKATSYYRSRGNVLDYIFVTNHFHKEYENRIAQLTDYVVLDEHLQENKNGSLLKSDHAQVVCELTFN